MSIKRILALILALTLCLSLAAPVYADGTAKVTFVNGDGTESETIVTLDQSNALGSYGILSKPADPTRENANGKRFEFDCWTAAGSAEDFFGDRDSAEIYSDTKLTAHWIEYLAEGYELILPGEENFRVTGYETPLSTLVGNNTGAAIQVKQQVLTGTAYTNYVAEFDGQWYPTLAEAIAAANADTTATPENPVVVKLLQDTSVSDAVVITNHVTIDGYDGTAYHTITTSAETGISIGATNVTAAVKNLTINSSKATRLINVDSNMTDVTLTIDNVTATSPMYTVNVRNGADNLNLTVTNSNLTGWGAVNLWGANGIVNISGCTLTGHNDKGYNKDGWNDFGTVIAEGDTTNQTTTGAVAYTISISDTTIKATTTGQGNHQWALLYNDNSVRNAMTLTNCTIDLGDDHCHFVLNQSDDGVLVSTTKIKNTYMEETSVLPALDEGFVYVDVADGYKQVVETVARINNATTGTPYPSLAAAIEAAENGDTIYLVANDTLSATVTIDKNITLNLSGNTIGSSMSGEDFMFEIAAGATVVVTGNGTITNDIDDTTHAKGLIHNYGTLTVENGTFNDYAQGFGAALRNEAGGVMNIQSGTRIEAFGTGSGNAALYNAGTLNIADGVAIVNHSTDGAVYQGKYGVYAIRIDAGTTTIGTLNAANPTTVDGNRGAFAVNGGTLIINSGTFTGHIYRAMWITNDYAGTYVTINGGTFIPGGSGSIGGSIDDGKQDQSDVAVTINDGFFDGNVSISNKGSTHIWTVAIKGGYYKSAPAASQIASGYELVANTDLSTSTNYPYLVQQHVHTYDYAPGTKEPDWIWGRINGAWAAAASFNCVKGDHTENVRATIAESTGSGTKTITATVVFGDKTYTSTKNEELSYNVYFEGTLHNSYKWGELCTLTFGNGGTPMKWVDGIGTVLADGRGSYTFPVTADIYITTEATNETEPVAAISATLTSNGTGKAVFNAKWSLPTGAEVESAIIYRGSSKTTNKDVMASALVSKGTQYDTQLYVRNGDFTLNLTKLTSGYYQHAVIVITYIVDGKTFTLTSGTESGTDYIANRVCVQ